MRILGLGHGLFAAAGAGLAILSFAFGDFAPIWQPLPTGFPGREVWVAGIALILLAASAGICFPRTALPGILAIGAYLAAWMLVRAAAFASDPLGIGSWYGICEPLAPLAAAAILYASLRPQSSAAQTPFLAGARAVRAERVLFGLACAVFGLAHFGFADLTASMVPAWLPGPMAFAYGTGLGHLAAGIGIALGILPRLAATLEAAMMSSFGLLVWVPSLFANPPPEWAMPPQNQWSELVVTLLLAASAWIIAASLRDRPWGPAFRSR